MARIAGVDLPKDKRADIGLTYVYGIGRAAALEILGKAGDRWINSRQGPERRAYRQDSRNYSGGLSGRRRSEKDLLDEHQAIDR